MRRLWQRHRLLLLAFGLALGLTLVFAVRAVMFTPPWPGAEFADRPVEGWMTPRFIVHAYGLPPEVVAEILAMPPHSDPHLPLAELARSRGLPLDALLDPLNAAIAAHRAGAGP